MFINKGFLEIRILIRQLGYPGMDFGSIDVVAQCSVAEVSAVAIKLWFYSFMVWTVWEVASEAHESYCALTSFITS